MSNPPTTSPSGSSTRWKLWINITITLLLIVGGLWFFNSQTSWQDLTAVFAQANPSYILASLLTITITILLKVWRWQKMLQTNHQTPPFLPLFWSFNLGLYLNAILPVVRVGEIARTVALYNKVGISKAQTLTTLVIEKLLEVVILAATILLLLSSTLPPAFLTDGLPTTLISVVAVGLLVILIGTAVYTQQVQHQLQKLSAYLPQKVQKYTDQLLISGLDGLSSLGNVQSTLIIFGLSIIIGITSVLAPYLLFFAFDIQLGLIEATIIHIAISIALVPPSTPAKIGVFDGVVAFLLVQFGLQNEAIIIGYTLIFHLIIYLPQIIFGVFASWQTNWQWSNTFSLSQP